MSKWACALFGVVLYVAALIAFAPASLLDFALERATAGGLRLTDARGTLWSGAGALEIRSADRKRAYAKALSWRAQPRSLFSGELRYALNVDGAPGPYRLAALPGGVQLVNAELRAPSAVLGIASPRIAPLLLTGEITLRVASMRIGPDGLEGDALVRWSDAGSTLVPFVRFGDYELRAHMAGKAGRAKLHTIDGPLTLSGEGAWASRETGRMRVRARIADSHYEKLAPLLRLIALERGDGLFELALR